MVIGVSKTNEHPISCTFFALGGPAKAWVNFAAFETFAYAVVTNPVTTLSSKQ